jgi:hypothetical protein
MGPFIKGLENLKRNNFSYKMNQIHALTFFGFIYLITNEITSKFMIGLVTGIYISTKYDMKPYVDTIETKLISFKNELEKSKEKTHYWSN